MNLNTHPYTIERQKLVDNGFLNLGSKVIQAQRLIKVEGELQNEGNWISECISEKIKTRDSKKKKLISKLKKIDGTYNYDNYKFNDKEIDDLLYNFNKKVKNYFHNQKELSEQVLFDYGYSRKKLKELYKNNKELYNSIGIVNGSIYDKIDNYILNEEENTKIRKLELVLTRIATHAITKTSPIGFLNRINILPNDRKENINRIKPCITVNLVFLFSFYEQLLKSDNVLPHIKLYKNVNFYVDENFIYVFFLTSDHKNRKVFKAKDQFVKIKKNELFVQILNNNKESWTIEELEEFLVISRENSLDITRKFMECGILYIKDYFQDGLEAIYDMLESLSCYEEYLDENNRKALGLVKEAVIKIESLNEKYDNNLHQEVCDLFNESCKLIGIVPFEDRSYLYIDNLCIQEGEHNISNELNKSIRDLFSIHAIFDVNTRIQQELINELKKSYEVIDISTRDEKIFTTVGKINLKYNNYWVSPNDIIPSESKVNQKLDELKKDFLNNLLSQDVKVDNNISVVEISQEYLNMLAEKIPYEVKNNQAAYSFFYQDGDKGIVINKIYPGYQSFYNRFVRYTDIMERSKDSIKKIYSMYDNEMAEIYETMGFNANAYSPLFDKRVKFDISLENKIDSEFEEVYDFYDLHLVEKDHNLYLKSSDDKYLKPIIATSLIRILYPGKLAFYSSLFSNISLFSDLHTVFLTNINNREIISTPRIVYRNLILERATWLVNKEAFEFLRGNINEDEIFKRLIKFITKNNLPTRFFYRARRKLSKDNSIRSIAQEFSKPQYLDLENMLLIKVLLNTLKTTTHILISEVYPMNLSVPEYLTEWTNHNGEEK